VDQRGGTKSSEGSRQKIPCNDRGGLSFASLEVRWDGPVCRLVREGKRNRPENTQAEVQIRSLTRVENGEEEKEQE
jgi:hypothetical protein